MNIFTPQLGKSIALVVIGFGLATLGPAPIMGQKLGLKPHTNLQAQDEKTLESEQHPVVMGQVGAIAEGHRDTEIGTAPGSQDALGVLNAGAQRNSGASAADASEAARVLNAANQRMAPPKDHSWIWALLVVGGVLGTLIGVKRWADNNIPNIPNSRPKTGNW